jgi:hypothetical protein
MKTLRIEKGSRPRSPEHEHREINQFGETPISNIL